MEPATISRKVAKGVAWVGAGAVVTRGIGFVGAVVLARWLTPADFGIFALALGTISILRGITTTGFEPCLLQKPHGTEAFLDTAWTFELLKHWLLFLITWAAAPSLAGLLGDADFAPLLRTMSIGFVFLALRNIAVLYFRKHLDFDRLVVFESVPVLVNLALALVLAWHWRSAWALAVGFVAETASSAILSYALHPYRPRAQLRWAKASEMFRFGRWIWLSSLTGLSRSHGVTLCVGGLLGNSPLGLHNRGLFFSKQLFDEASVLFWKVAFPALAAVHLERARFRALFLDGLTLMAGLGIPAAAWLFAMRASFVEVFLTAKWLPMLPVMEVGLMISVLALILAPCHVSFQAAGKPKLGSTIALLEVIILFALLFPLIERLHVLGAAIAMLISIALLSPVTVVIALRLTECSFRELGMRLVFAFSSAMLVAAAALGFQRLLPADGIMAFGVHALIAAGTLLIAWLALDKRLDIGAVRLARRFVHNCGWPTASRPFGKRAR